MPKKVNFGIQSSAQTMREVSESKRFLEIPRLKGSNNLSKNLNTDEEMNEKQIITSKQNNYTFYFYHNESIKEAVAGHGRI